MLLVCASALGCARDPAVPLTQWRLVLADEATRDVLLPARLPLPDRPVRYLLRADVVVPEAMRGAPVSVAIADTLARATLRVDGLPALPCLPSRMERYRSNGSLCWHFVAPSGAAAVRLEIEADHTTPLTALFDTAPQLVAASDGGASFQRVVRFDDATELGSACVAGLLGTFYAAAFLFDRTRRAHLWFALQALGGMFYPLWWLGALQLPFGCADRCVLVEAMLGGGLASLYFAHVQLRLGPVHRAWRYFVGAGALLALAQIAPFPPPVLPLITAGLIGLPTGTVVVLCARAVLRSRERFTALVIGLTWLAIVLAAPFDVPALIGLPTHAGGVRVMSLAIAVVGLGQGALLARQHVTSLRNADALNVELRRQVADRSRELADALAQLGSPTDRELEVADVVGGRYRVVRSLGSGGMGRVYEVERLPDKKRLALKMLHGTATHEHLARLAREGQIAARIDHPNLVAVRDIDVTTEHGLFVVMDLVEGGSLADLRARYGDRPWALRILREVSEGLVALHAAGVVHRDLKPANVLVGSDGIAKISDFGISSLVEARVSALASTIDVGDAPTQRAAGMTRTGVILGTPLYMAPELAAGSKLASTAVDVFALGVLAFELLDLGYPFAAPPIVEAIYGRPLVRTRATHRADKLAGLFEACLEAEPAKRPTAKAMSDGLAAT
ncbi:MAG TPA: serine/threonine-protein kinase [Polyangiaceae bacterium]